MKELFETQLVELVISTLSTIITAVLLPLAVKFIQSKLNNSRHQEVVAEISEAVSRSVEYLEVKMVQQYKNDGLWNSETQKEVLNSAVEMVIGDLSSVALKNLDLTSDELRSRIEKEIEKYIAEKKSLKASSAKASLTGK